MHENRRLKSLYRYLPVLREYEAEFKKALGRESGAAEGLFNEKTEVRKSRDTVSLRYRYSNINIH
jgi:hypothetical protein